MSRILNKSRIYDIVLILYFILSFDVVFSQIKDKGIPFIHNYTKEEYQGSSQIWSITQGYKGIMYFATDNGVIAFDGSYWRKYHVSDNVAARAVKADPEGNLYAGGPNSIGVFYPSKSGRFKYQSLLEETNPPINDIGNVWNIFLLSDKKVIHSDKGLYVIYKDTTIHFESEYSKAFQIEDKVFITNKENGLQVLDGETLRTLPDAESFKDLYVSSLFAIGESKYLIATLRNGLFIYENN